MAFHMSAYQKFTLRLLRLPIFYKILLANSVIVAFGALAGTSITIWHVQNFPNDFHCELIGFFAIAGLAISIVANYVVLKLALKPLDHLQRAVDQVRAGKLDVRANAGTLSDERFDRLAETFNQMLAMQAEATERLHHLSQEILQAQEDERQRVARELHDQTAQSLTSLLVRLRLLERAQDPAEA
jgi:two-component system sensor histidine kinase UhpB